MDKDTTKSESKASLLDKLFELIQLHRVAFRQDRPYERSIWLLLSELFTFGRHTVTQGIQTLGEGQWDWSAWYRLFSEERFNYEQLTTVMMQETIKETPAEQPYVVAGDGVIIPRSSQTMPGTSWWKAPGTAAFKPGLARGQRFINLSWLVPMVEGGYSRAIPLRMIAAYPEKAVKAEEAPCKDWEALLNGLKWGREQLDEAGRKEQLMLTLVDGGFERTAAFWKGLPERVVVMGRSACNRKLHEFPEAYDGKGRPNTYGKQALRPHEWLRKRKDWKILHLPVRGKPREVQYQLHGPYLREGASEHPVFLFVIRGMDRVVHGVRIRRKPIFFLVSAIQVKDKWVLPFDEELLLSWAWQRWEVEVAHREMKSGFGVGEKQCWNPRSATRSVQWSTWAYSILLLAGYRTWGLRNGPSVPTRWWHGAQRWSFNTLWRAYRAELWGAGDFRAVCSLTMNNWAEKQAWLAAFSNAAAFAARS